MGQLTTFEINFYFGIVGLVFSIVYNTLISANLSQFGDLIAHNEGSVLKTLFLLSAPALSGVCLTIASFICVDTGGPILVNIAGTIKDVLLTYASLLFLGEHEVPPSTLALAGLALSFIGVACQLAEKLQAPQPAP